MTTGKELVEQFPVLARTLAELGLSAEEFAEKRTTIVGEL